MKISYSNEVEDIIKPKVNVHEYDTAGIIPDTTFLSIFLLISSFLEF